MKAITPNQRKALNEFTERWNRRDIEGGEDGIAVFAHGINRNTSKSLVRQGFVTIVRWVEVPTELGRIREPLAALTELGKAV